MSFAPFVAIWAVLIIASVVGWLGSRRSPRLAKSVAAAAPLLALALWFAIRFLDVAPSMSWAGYAWRVDETSWSLTGIALWLLFLSAALSFLPGGAPSGQLRPDIGIGLTAAALPTLWAGDTRTQVLGIAILVVGYAASSWISKSDQGLKSIRPAVWLAAALFPLWLGDALPGMRPVMGVLSAMLLMGVWPFQGARARVPDHPVDLTGMGLPVVAGAAVLSSSLAASAPPAAIVMATTTGLMSMLAGLAWAWSRSLTQLARALGMGLAGLVVVAGLWAGLAPLVAATRLAVFGPALVLLISISGGRQNEQRGEMMDSKPRLVPGAIPGAIGAAVLYLALSGFPLTVGFGTLSPLYEAWRSAGGWILIVVLALVITFWLAAIAWNSRHLFRNQPAGRDAWLRRGLLILPVLGLLSINLSGLAIDIPTWVALLAPLIAGAIVGRLTPGLDSLDESLRESLVLPPLSRELVGRARRLLHGAAGALDDALAILEGQFGLLWLLGLLMLLIWISR